MHSFSGGEDILRSLLKLEIPVYFSFSLKAFAPEFFNFFSTNSKLYPEISEFEKIIETKSFKSIEKCPLENLLLETDAPYQLNLNISKIIQKSIKNKENSTEFGCFSTSEYFKSKVNWEKFAVENCIEKLTGQYIAKNDIKDLSFPFMLRFSYILSSVIKRKSLGDLSKIIMGNFRKAFKV